MKSLQSYFEHKKEGVDVAIDDKTLFHIFSQIILEEYGRQGSRAITPSFYKNKILFIKFSQSLWAQEVWTNRGHLIKKVNERIGQEMLVNIKAH